jgi:hypothetical protein
LTFHCSLLQVTVHVQDDLVAARTSALKAFSTRVEKLRSDCGMSSLAWNFDSELLALRSALEEYCASREEQFKLTGVLSRAERPPVELSIHTLAVHPFGRDSRQDPLATSARDEVVFDETLKSWQPRAQPLAPGVRHAGSLERDPDDRQVSRSDREFAREMLMLPLSIKNPSVPLVSGRNRRRVGPPARSDATRAADGPERFLQWDNEPMQRVAEAIEEQKRWLRSSGRGQENEDEEDEEAGAGGASGPLPLRLRRTQREMARVVSRAFRAVPVIGRDYYEHPSINSDERLRQTVEERVF